MTPVHTRTAWAVWTTTAALALLAALAASAYWTFAPAYESYVTTGGVGITAPGGLSGGAAASRETLLEVQGPGVLVILAVPVVISALPLLVRSPGARAGVGWLSAFLVTAFALLGGFSIGLLYLPAAAVLWAAAVVATVLARRAAAAEGA